MTITPEQCRAARELLGWTQGYLQKKSRLGIETIGNFERGSSNPTDRTFYDLTKAFEDAGIKFIDDEIQIGATLLKKKE
ncbi:MAG: transcriptional regulator with XRE-family HTH domain [Myxococcota bacterium]|jgi:transcriptional regulator with XRE-family HTH domain